MQVLARFLIASTFLAPACALADTMDFSLNGTLQDGGTLTGTLRVNRTGGYVNPVGVTVTDGSYSYVFTGSFFQGPYQGTSPLEFYSTSYDQAGDNLLLSFPALLTGYAGGALCSTTLLCQGLTSSFNSAGAKPDYFTSLSASNVPEPTSFALVLTGLAAATKSLVRRRR